MATATTKQPRKGKAEKAEKAAARKPRKAVGATNGAAKRSKDQPRLGGRASQARRRWTLFLNDEDHINIQKIQGSNPLIKTNADAVRHALRQTAARIKEPAKS